MIDLYCGGHMIHRIDPVADTAILQPGADMWRLTTRLPNLISVVIRTGCKGWGEKDNLRKVWMKENNYMGDDFQRVFHVKESTDKTEDLRKRRRRVRTKQEISGHRDPQIPHRPTFSCITPAFRRWPPCATSLLSISLPWRAFAFCWPHIFLFSEPAHCCAVVLSGPLISKSGIPWICWSPPSDDVAMHGWGNWRICPPSSFHSTMLFSYLILCARFLSRLFSLYVFYCRNPLQTH